MNRINAVVASLLLAISMGAMAHEGKDHKKTGPVKKEQKAWGIAADDKAAGRTVEVTMGDNMRFTPDRLQIQQGEVVKIVIKNNGQMLHEMVIGTKAELDEHAALMVKFPGMEHDEPYMAHVKPGSSGEIVWNFNRAGEFDFACLIAGHYQAGMVGKIVVAAAPAVTQAQATQPSPAAVASKPAANDMTEAEVRKIDKDNQKITLKHGEIKNLDMPPMTMVFRVAEAGVLDKLKPGDKVRFKASNEGGNLTATEIQAAR